MKYCKNYNQQNEYNDEICRIQNLLTELNTKIGKYEQKRNSRYFANNSGKF